MKILVAVDPSDTVFLPVAKAAALAKKEGAELTLLAVAEALEDIESLFGGEATAQLEKRAAKALEAARAVAKAEGVTAKEMLEIGVSPEEFIVDAAEQGGFDLVVMGTRGKKGVRRLLLGSVASKVVALAPCSVLVVR
jgi:nucleotide-binding universal stress UspA family protein